MTSLKVSFVKNPNNTGTSNVELEQSGNITVDDSINATGIVTATSLIGSSATFGGSVSVGGTLTYEDVTSVDSVGLITARIGVDVTSGGIDAVGVFTATSFSGDGSSLTGTGIGTDGSVNTSGIITATSFFGDGSNLTGIEFGVRNFVASGTIPNGSTVILKEDGKVGVVTESSAPTAGTPVVFESADIFQPSVVYDSSNNKVVIVYSDQGNSSYGTAIVGTVSGTSISFGTPVVFESAITQFISATFDSSNNKVVIAYQDYGNSSYGTAIVGTVSGTSISFGTPVVFNSTSTGDISSTFDSTNQKVVIAYRNQGNSNYGTAIVGTVSGTSISFGSAVVFESDTSFDISGTFDSNNNKVVIAYRDNGNSNYGTAIVGTVSGTSISFGTAVVFESSASYEISVTYDSTNQKVVIAYQDDGNSSYGTAIVGTVSGTSISFGTPVVFNSNPSNYCSATFDPTSNKVVIGYSDGWSTSYGTVIVGTISGTSISFGTPTVFNSGRTRYYIVSTYDSSNNKVVIAYEDNGNSNYGTAVVITTEDSITNLTAKNYVGLAAEAISDGATGKVSIFGGINESQSGLTTARKYYVQASGGIGLTASTPSVVAGTSISSTKMIVKS